MKKESVLIILLLLIVPLSLTFLVAQSACEVRSGDSCQSGEVKLMGLSDTTNAHGEMPLEDNYGFSLCCPSGSLTCNGNNEVLSLSSDTNAHAETFEEDNYGNAICYGNEATSYRVSTTGSCNEGEFEVITLSDTTNAHIGTGYSLTICGTGGGFAGGSQEAGIHEWMNTKNELISTSNITPEISKVRLYFEKENISDGTEIIFSIWDEDLFFDDGIRTQESALSSETVNGTTFVDWTITQEDLDRAQELGEDYDGFYFRTSQNGTSDYLALSVVEADHFNNVFTCSDYTNEIDCNNDDSGLVISVAQNGLEADCNNPNINCYCDWDSNQSQCNSAYEYVGEEGNAYGTCLVSEEQVDENGCDDGFLTVSWTGTWLWNEEENPEHEDPEGLALACEDVGTKVVECPAQIQLSFFETKNVLISLLIIAAIYLIFFGKRSGSRKRIRKR